MKKLFIIPLFLFTYLVSFSQTFYVERTDKGYEQPIIDKLIELNKEITTKQENSKYTIQCIISKKGGYGVPGEGYIIILDSQSGNMVLKSESAKGMVNAFRGFQNPSWLIMQKIAKKHLAQLLEQLKK